MSAFFPPGSPPQDVLGAQVGNLLARVRALEGVTSDSTLTATGWTVVFGDGTTPIVTGDYQVVWKVPKQIVGDTGFDNPWYIYEPSAHVITPSSVDIVIWLYRVRSDGFNPPGVSALLDSPLTIDAGTYDSEVSVSPVVVTQFANVADAPPGAFDSIMVGIDAGNGAGLSMDVPIGKEQPTGSGYHIP